MRTKTPIEKAPAEQVEKDIRSATRKHYSAKDKIRIVLEGLRNEDSIAELWRGVDIVESLGGLKSEVHHQVLIALR